MKMIRFENNVPGSSVEAVLFYFEGLMGARFVVQYTDYESDPDTPLTEKNVNEFINSQKNNLSDELIKKMIEIQIGNSHKIGNLEMYSPSTRNYNPNIRTAIKDANKTPPVIEYESYNKKDTILVKQSCIITTNPVGPKPPILGTYGAGPCVILTAYNPETGNTLLAHIDDMSRALVFKELDKFTEYGQIGYINLIGGNSSSRTSIVDILDYIKNNPKLVLQGARVVTHEADKVAIDSRTGKLLFTEPGMLNDGVNYKNDESLSPTTRMSTMPTMPTMTTSASADVGARQVQLARWAQARGGGLIMLPLWPHHPKT
jgi:hypothetical protein